MLFRSSIDIPATKVYVNPAVTEITGITVWGILRDCRDVAIHRAVSFENANDRLLGSVC